MIPKLTKDIMYFVCFCIEQYKKYKNMEGREVSVLFNEKGVTKYLADNFEVLHTQSRQWLIEEIDEYLENQKK